MKLEVGKIYIQGSNLSFISAFRVLNYEKETQRYNVVYWNSYDPECSYSWIGRGEKNVFEYREATLEEIVLLLPRMIVG
jgi:hypothetical protein